MFEMLQTDLPYIPRGVEFIFETIENKVVSLGLYLYSYYNLYVSFCDDGRSLSTKWSITE